MTSSPIEILKVWAKRAARSGGQKFRLRNLSLVLVGGTLGLSADEMARLTVQEARQRLPQDSQALATVNRLVAAQGLAEGDLVFMSRKGQGQQPVNRVTIWRVLSRTGMGAIRALRRLAQTLQDAGTLLIASTASIHTPPSSPKIPTPTPPSFPWTRIILSDLLKT